MASSRLRSPDVGYPQLHKDQIDLVIEALIVIIRERNLGPRIDVAESTAADLTAFYTRKWGLPPAITGRQARIREMADAGQVELRLGGRAPGLYVEGERQP